MENNKALVPIQPTPAAIMVRDANGQEIALNEEIVRKYLCPKASTSEIWFFLNTCVTLQLNPFLRDIYLVKYGEEPAAIIVGKDAFLKRANEHPDYGGFTAGIIVEANMILDRREGAFIRPEGETLLGGWAKVRRRGFEEPFTSEVSLKEYQKWRKDPKTGEWVLQALWKSKAPTMIRKVALVQALREAYPEKLRGLYVAEELAEKKLPSKPIVVNYFDAAERKGEVIIEREVIEAEAEEVKKRSNKWSRFQLEAAEAGLITHEQREAFREQIFPGKRVADYTADEVAELVEKLEKIKAAPDYEEPKLPF